MGQIRHLVPARQTANARPKMLAWIAALFLCALQAPLTPLAAADTPIRFLTHSLGDSSFTSDDGLLHGKPHAGRRAFYVETIMAMMAYRGQQFPIQEVSLNRGFLLLSQGRETAFFNLIKNQTRAPLYKWVGPISKFPTYYYELKSQPSGVKTLADTKTSGTICALKGNNLVQLLKSMGHTNILEASSDIACARMLRHGRVNLITGAEYPWFIRDPEFADLFVRTPVILSTDEGYIAFSKSVPDAQVTAWQDALNQIRKNGTFARLRAQFLVPDDAKASRHTKSGRRKPTFGK
jgi:polar amino acid transport system substrate-binding protein